MATTPGLLTNWPWHYLGNFKYVVLAPWVVHYTYSYTKKEEKERDIGPLLILPFLLWRMLHNQLWISLSRYQTAKSKHRIVDKGIEFEQVDRERNWDDQILLNGLLFYVGYVYVPQAKNIPFFRWDGIVMTVLLHMGPVEFIYYWLHRALHHHFLYSRYHSHHHSSIVTEPITSVIHPFGEHILYYLLFSIPIFTMLYTRTTSIVAMVLYPTYIDFMNNLGHCNFELVPIWLFNIFPFLKYLMYTPSFHSLHHTQFRTNYSLFMPFYDYIYGTMDKSTDTLFETTTIGRIEEVQVVHLTHPTTLESIYHLQPGLASFASGPYASKWYFWILWPLTYGWSMFMAWMCDSTFTVERNVFNDLKMQIWAIPRYSFHYFLSWQKDAINTLIEKAILEANERGVKVMSLGLLNQGEELNGNGELYITNNPKLRIRIVDGSSLAVAIVLDSIPKGIKQVLLRGRCKIATAIAQTLSQRGVQVAIASKEDLEKIKLQIPIELRSNLIHSSSYKQKVWLVDENVLTEEEQRHAPKGTHFIPFTQFPLKKLHKECVYYNSPSMVIPKAIENVHSCENWLPRRVMSAWRIAGIVHALEGWNEHECGETMFDIEKVWHASLRHGFRPVVGTIATNLS